MIFVCVGSREYQFNRLLAKIDELIADGELNEKVFAQIGQSDYLPKGYDYERFMSIDDFKEYQKKADIIISHGGTGALIGALKLGKQVIAVPRLEKYGEHIDDHQIQISSVLAEEGYLRYVTDMDKLIEEIRYLQSNPIVKQYNRPSYIMEIIEDFINRN